MEPVVIVVLAGAMVVFAGVTITVLVMLLRRTGGLTGRPVGPTPEQLAEIHAELETARREAVGILDRAEQEAAETLRRSEQDAAEALRRSEQDAAAILRRSEAAAESAAQMRKEVEAETQVLKYELKELRSDLERRENRLAEREQRLDEEARRQAERARKLAETETELAARREDLDRLAEERRAVLERVAGLTSTQARAELVGEIANQAKREAALIVREIESDARKEGEKRATKIITLAVQRMAAEQTAESVVSVLHLPGDEMKGRIIGREGRNIRAFESTTGVNLIIDDTPEAVLLSCFDPVRRETARLTLEKLVLDGRIHPQRIEDAYERSRTEVQELCVRAGEDALVELGITDMHPELVTLLGQLRYRTSYGQNVLGHLVESAHIAGIMAAELKLDQTLLKRCTLLHDIGKALTHEVEGSHALIGAEIARRYGEHEDVVHAIEAHHNEVEVRTVEAVLTQAADAISGGRPGARRESLEAYVKRLERLEEIAQSYDGVEKVFAMQAGREIRVMVKPDSVDDIQASVIARDVAKRIEEELTYPGQIRIAVVRESRAIEFAR
ncbi:ribonuclease Y [Planobispora longispora]|uniref:Ribonuclease Y n=1 Tax=Planobispora longispora TaxID=28887 RepID=A0A8J3RPP1_9ACTN|nr:ribonuclease Y [Planobispora longispora]BFE87854.1 ribonuclease Y [Planobispora longispora]GIH77637.1 ribonuclease Y [Planobispora longispora]